jgi:hypothetical protein
VDMLLGESATASVSRSHVDFLFATRRAIFARRLP